MFFIPFYLKKRQLFGIFTKMSRNLSDLNGEECVCREIEIPVPWGKIAAKMWNVEQKNKRPILLAHGWKVLLYFFKTL